MPSLSETPLSQGRSWQSLNSTRSVDFDLKSASDEVLKLFKAPLTLPIGVARKILLEQPQDWLQAPARNDITPPPRQS